MRKYSQNISTAPISPQKSAYTRNCGPDAGVKKPGPTPARLDTKGHLTTDVQKTLDKSKLRKRARAKYLTQSIAGQLADLKILHEGTDKDGNANQYWGKSVLHRSYIKSLFCASELTQTGDKITGKYCRARWCVVCNRIRTAKLISDYSEVLENLPNKQFMTLTLRNIPGSQLPDTLDKMNETIRRINKQLTHYLKKRGIVMSGVRKLEVTYNKYTDEYHPHFHFIISAQQFKDKFVCPVAKIPTNLIGIDDALLKDGYVKRKETRRHLKELKQKNRLLGEINNIDELHEYEHTCIDSIAVLYIKLWLQYMPGTLAEAQDVRQAKEGSAIELFKYFTKLTQKQKDGDRRDVMPVHALDTIFVSMYNRRVFQSFGNILKVSEEIDELQSETIAEELQQDDNKPVVFKWHAGKYEELQPNGKWKVLHMADWYSTDTGECLCDYDPNKDNLIELVYPPPI